MDPLYLVTFIGEPELWIALMPLLIILYFVVRFQWPKYRMPMKRFLTVLVPSLAIVLVIMFFIKIEFPVARPCVPCTMIQETCNPYCPANDPSFPSGHATTIFTVFASLWLVQRKRWQLPVFIIPAIVAYSRVALGVHTWIDVAVGSAMGLAVTWLVWREAEKRVFSKQKRIAS